MANSNRLFDDLATPATHAPRERKRTGGLLNQRDSELSELASGAIEDKMQRWVDPGCCRLWQRHNRRYDLLTQARCQDLIDGFKAQGRQEFPAIVRKLDADPQYQYEVVCGARRHWTVTWLRANNYAEFKFLIEVRDLTDEQAFRLSDIENRDNLDLSDYERAVDYKDALGRYYANQKDMKPYLKDRQARQKVVSRAKAMRQMQAERAGEGRGYIAGAQVVRELVGAAKTSKAPSQGALAEYRSSTGKVMMSVNRQGNRGLVLRIARNSGASKAELLDSCRTVIDEYC